jgi:hypothetical protein
MVHCLSGLTFWTQIRACSAKLRSPVTRSQVDEEGRLTNQDGLTWLPSSSHYLGTIDMDGGIRVAKAIVDRTGFTDPVSRFVGNKQLEHD